MIGAAAVFYGNSVALDHGSVLWYVVGVCGQAEGTYHKAADPFWDSFYYRTISRLLLQLQAEVKQQIPSVVFT